MNSAQKINEFIGKTKAFENMPKEVLTKTKNHMLKDGWKENQHELDVCYIAVFKK